MPHAHAYSDRFAAQAVYTVDPTAQALLSTTSNNHHLGDLQLPRNLCFADKIADVSRIEQADKNILIHFWQPSDQLRHIMTSTSFDALPTLDLDFKAVDLGKVVQSLADPLVALIFQELLPILSRIRDIAAVKYLNLTLGKLQDRMCPLFHVDRLTLRTICTLRGPGTEWLDDAEVIRQHLGKGSNRDIMLPSATIYQMGLFHLGLFKGEKFKGGRRRGLVHRSPAVDPKTTGRWYLRMDATS